MTTRTKLIALVVALVVLAGAGVALAGGFPALLFTFFNQAPDTVRVQRSCYPGTLDAVYVARGTDATGQALPPMMTIIPSGCVRATPQPPTTNER